MLLYISVCLRTRQDTISYSFIYIVQKLELETGDQDRDRGTPKLWYTPKLWTGTVVLRNYGTLKLWTGTVVLRNYSEITPKLWLAIVLVYWSVSQDPRRPIEDIGLESGYFMTPCSNTDCRRQLSVIWAYKILLRYYGYL